MGIESLNLCPQLEEMQASDPSVAVGTGHIPTFYTSPPLSRITA